MRRTANDRREILVIEDWPADQERFEILFQRSALNADIRFAWDGWSENVPDVEYILRLIEAQQPNCVLLDLAWTREDEELAVELRAYADPDVITRQLEIYPPEEQLSGLYFLSRVKERFPSLPVVVVTQYRTEPLAKVCMRRGAENVYRKWDQIEPLMKNVFSVLEYHREVAEFLRQDKEDANAAGD